METASYRIGDRGIRFKQDPRYWLNPQPEVSTSYDRSIQFKQDPRYPSRKWGFLMSETSTIVFKTFIFQAGIIPTSGCRRKSILRHPEQEF